MSTIRGTLTKAFPVWSTTGSRGLVRGLLALVFLSGASGLIYQMLWVRTLTLSFGVTTYAVSTVLTGFMSGLALGSHLAGRVADRLQNPLRAYGLVEIGIGVTGLLTPVAFHWVQVLYRGFHELVPTESLLLLSIVRFALSFAVLLIPTTLMGATLPLVVRSSLLRSAQVSRNISLLYALNTAGAVAGTFGAGFFLIGGYGIRVSILLAAALNLLVGFCSLALSTRVGGRSVVDVEASGMADAGASEPRYTAAARWVVFVAYGLGGACSLAYEVVWTRVLVIFSNSSTYAFTIMLTIVLLGIAAGSYVINLYINRRVNWLLIFALIELAVGVLGTASIFLFGHLYEILGWRPGGDGLTDLPIALLALGALIVIFPTMFLLGMTFPVAARVYMAGYRDVGRRLGSIYAVNVFGAIFGSFAAGFILVPGLGTQASLTVLSVANLLLALLLVACLKGRRGRAGILKPAAVAGVLILSVVAVRLAPDMYQGIFAGRFPDQEVVWQEEGLENSVAVARSRVTGVTAMYLNGYHQADDSAVITQSHRIIAHLPVLVHPRARDILIIGLGGGATAGAFTQHPDVRLDVVELSESVLRAARFFKGISYDVLHQPGVQVRVDDGRNYLLLTQRRYDVITADIIRPHQAGSTNLYSREYFELARSALREDGVMIQWIHPSYDYQYKMIMRTFLESFPHVSLWLDGSLMIGSTAPLRLDRAVLEAKFGEPRTKAALDAAAMTDVAALLSKFNATEEELRPQLSGIPSITDDHPYAEYFRNWADRHEGDTFDPRALSGDVSTLLVRPDAR